MSDAALLNVVLYLPVAGILAIIALPARADDGVRRLSLGVMALQFVLTALLYARFDPAVDGLQFETRLPWIASWGVYYQIGLDGYNMLLVLLTAFLGPLVVWGAFTAIQKDVKLFYAMVFALQFAMVGTFVAQDLFLFYLFWEAMLIPLFLIIGIWGGERRIYATLKFVLYTAFGSILMLAAVIYLVYSLETTSGVTSFAFADLYRAELPLPVQTVLLAAFALSFAIKVPIVPLHTWLPDAHVEAPTAGSVILAGVLLKMGTYGFMKLAFPLFPDATRLFAPVFGTLAVVSILYGACLALVQTDIKKVIAYSSISHLGYVMLGLVSLDLIGIQGAVMQMVSHGLVAGGLFLMVGMIYERCHTRELAAYGGHREAPAACIRCSSRCSRWRRSGCRRRADSPANSWCCWARSGRRGRCTRTAPPIRSCSPASAVAGVVLGALYMLGFAQRFLFGAAKAPHQPFADLTFRERRDPLRHRRRRVRARPLSGRADEEDRARGAAVPATGQQRAHRWRSRIASRALAGRDTRGACRAERREASPRAHDELGRRSSSPCCRSTCCSPASSCCSCSRSRAGTPREAYVVSLAAVTLATAAAVWLALRRLRRCAVPRTVLGGCGRGVRQGHRARARAARARHRARRLRTGRVPHPAAVLAVRRLPAPVRRTASSRCSSDSS